MKINSFIPFLTTLLLLTWPGTTSAQPQTDLRPYFEREVTYTNAHDGTPLGATLTVPTGPGRFPAVLLITGMGPQDRDETIGPLKPFAVIADHMARAGVAVLRVDDRGMGKSGGNWMSSYDTYCEDVRCGLEYLRQQPEIDGRHLGLLGHSEGGVIGTMVAAQCPEVHFLIMLASPCVPAEQYILRHNEGMLRRANVTGEKLEKELDGVRELVRILKTTPDPAELKSKLHELISRKPQSAEETEREVAMYCTPWARDYMTSDMTVSLRKLTCPTLALWGSKDVLVEPEQNMTGIKTVLNETKAGKLTVEILPDMNHLFQRCQTGNVDEFFQIKGCMDPKVLELISAWTSKCIREL
jgi:pimeloyl-ACP methyl ester carboxylesterase